MADGTIITSVTDGLAVCMRIIESANNEVVYISPPSLLVLGSQFGFAEKTKALVQKGGRVRGIADFSYQYIGMMRELLDIGTDVRHFPQYQGPLMLVGDKRESVSSMGVAAKSFSIDSPIVLLWSDDPTYAEFLVSVFETAWEQSVPIAQRIEELLKEGPSDI
jgi:hypothetical protein